jgi:hypothetical protein
MIDTKKEKKDDEDLFWESEKKTLEKKVKQNAGSLLFSKVFFTPKEVSCFPNTNRDHRDHRRHNKEDDEKKEKEENIASSWRWPFRNLPAGGAGGSPEGKLGSATPTTNSNTTFAFQT